MLTVQSQWHFGRSSMKEGSCDTGNDATGDLRNNPTGPAIADDQAES